MWNENWSPHKHLCVDVYSSFCCCLVAKLCLTLCGPWTEHTRLPCPSLSLGVCPNSCPLSWWCHPSNHLILCCRLLLLPSIFPISRVFYNELALLTRWPMYWSFSLSIILGLISFRIDWFDLFAVPGTLKSLPQQCNLKSSVLPHSVFFMVQLSFYS